MTFAEYIVTDTLGAQEVFYYDHGSSDKAPTIVVDRMIPVFFVFFFFQAEDGIRDADVTGVQTCALPICLRPKIRRFIRRLMRKGHAHVSEVRVLHSRGDWRWLDCVGRDMRSDPDVHGLVLTIRDVSFRVHNLRELEATRDGTFRALGVALEARDYEDRKSVV